MVGIDANADNLRTASRRAGASEARGGLPNLLFGRLALERAPGALEGLADRLSVLLPWGSLLRAAAGGEPEGLRRLRGLCAPGAELEAKRLTRSDPGRRFVRLAGTAVPAPEPATPGSAPRTGS